MHKINLWDILDKAISEERPPSTREVALYPSEASALIKNEYGEIVPIGGCIRKSWFRNKLQRMERNKEFQTEAIDEIVKEEFPPHQLWKFGVSNKTEDLVADMCKKAGIYKEQGHKFKYHIDMGSENHYPDAYISGEIDILVRIPVEGKEGEFFEGGLEVKSITGYHGQKMVFGHRSSRTIIHPEPKIEHLLQSILYAYVFRKDLNFFKLIYLSREDGRRIEYDISFRKNHKVSSTLDAGEEKHLVYVNNKPYKYELYAEDIFDRYKELQQYIIDDIIPPRDYDLQYSDEKIKLLYERGLLSKTDKEAYEKGKKLKKGDWMCAYCSYSDNCYTSKGTPIKYNQDKIDIESIKVKEDEDEE